MSACDSFVNPNNGAVYRKSGTYKATIFNKAGCDSSIAYFVTIGNKDTNFIYYNECLKATLTNGSTVVGINCHTKYGNELQQWVGPSDTHYVGDRPVTKPGI